MRLKETIDEYPFMV